MYFFISGLTTFSCKEPNKPFGCSLLRPCKHLLFPPKCPLLNLKNGSLVEKPKDLIKENSEKPSDSVEESNEW